MEINTDKVTGLVLAGGAGTRVGGRDKGLIEWQGKPLIAHAIEGLRDQTSDILICCNRNITEYECYGYRTVEDKRSNFQGPLAGIEAAADWVTTDYLVVVACDTPLLPKNLVQRLLAPLLPNDNDNPHTQPPLISFAHDGRREQYLFSILNTQCLSGLTAFLDEGLRTVGHWYRENPHVVVDFSDQEEAFQNYNYIHLP